MRDALYATLFNSAVYSLRVISCFSILLIITFLSTGLRGTSFMGETKKIMTTIEQDGLEASYISQKQFTKEATLVPKVVYNQESRYSIRYPSTWQYGDSNSQSPNFTLSGQEGTLSFMSNVNIQTIKMVKIGDVDQTTSQMMLSLQKRISRQVNNVRYVENGPISLHLLNGSVVNGEYVVFTFSNKGLAFKQWQVIMPRGDGQVFYVWSFVSPLMQYSRDLTSARAMLNSWNFY